MSIQIPLQHLSVILGDRIVEASALRSPKNYDDLSDLPYAELQNSLTSLIAAIERIAGTETAYGRRVANILESDPSTGGA